MDEQHLEEDQLITLALGDLGPEQATVLKHLNSCLPCRAAYDELSKTVDSLLPATPSVAPPAGFDARVLERIGIRPQQRRRSLRVPLLIAAAALIGLVLGGVGARTVFDQDPPAVVASGTPLMTGSGSQVGTVQPSQLGGRGVVVLQVSDGRPGAHYTCRVVRDDGTVVEVGDWVVPESGRATWIAEGSTTRIDRIEMVTDKGRVWSSATLS